MRRAAAVVLVGTCVLAGCGGAQHEVATTTHSPRPVHRTSARRPPGLRVGVIGTLTVSAPGASVVQTTTAGAGEDRLVLVDARQAPLPVAVQLARAHPATQFAAIGASAKAQHLPNLAGVVLRDDEAALLGGIVAGLVLRDQTSVGGRVAWVGPQERRLAGAFARGVQEVAPGATVLRVWSSRDPAACKEAALSAVDRGAVAVMAHGGDCAAAAASGAHEQNQPALDLGDFELPSVAASAVVRDAVAGVFHGGHDVVFGAESGAIAIRRLDPLIPASVALQAQAAAQQLASGLRPTG
jgi:basic membrane lipoprotein Med (substrate-binding protein (PBP1-ABC) superfamily)